MYNNDCNHHCENPSVTNCCIPAIRETLEVIKDCVDRTANVPGFGVNIIITLNSGLTYDISINAGVLNSLIIHEKLIVVNDTTISLCDIAKIKILTTGPANPNFIKCLKSKLCKITNPHKHSCDDYLAVSFDDEDSDSPVYKHTKKTKNKCKCEKNYSEKPNSNTCCCDTNKNSSNATYYKHNDYPNNDCKYNNCNPCKKCGTSYENECSCNKEIQRALDCQEKSIESIGLEGGVRTVGTVGSIDDIYYTTVLNSAKVNVSTIPLLSNAQAIYNTTPVLTSISPKSTNVVSSVELQQTKVLTNINQSTIALLKDIITNSVSVVADINLLSPVTIISSITPSTITVAAPIQAASIPVVNTISLYPSKVITNVIASTVSAISDLGTPNTSTAISKITPATLAVVNSVTATTLAVVNSVTATTLAVVNSVTATTLAVVDSVTATTLATIKDLGSITTITAITGYPAPQTIIASSSIQITSINSNLVNSVGLTTINNITSTPTIAVVSSVVSSSGVILPINPTSPTSKININNPTTKIPGNAVSDVTPISVNINAVGNVNTITIAELGNPNYKSVVTDVSIKPTYENAINNVGLSTTSTTVVEKITIKDATIISSDEQPISGSIICLGKGIMVVEENSGAISVYSLCEIISFTTK